MAHSEETKAKIRKAWEARRLTFVPPMKGKRMSEESRRKMSDAGHEPETPDAGETLPDGQVCVGHFAGSLVNSSNRCRCSAERPRRL